MTLHLHHTRRIAAWVLTAFALSPLTLALSFGSPQPANPELAPVTGHLTIAGKPAADVFICIDSSPSGNCHEGFSWVHAGGSFRLGNMQWFEGGVPPGHYYVHLYTQAGGPEIPARYLDQKTSGIELDVASGWNDFHIDLP
jgi:hypothetical protein